jgi:hypothetical protein
MTTQTRALPHDPYITAVIDALADVGLDPTDITLDDCDTRGTHCYLRAVITYDEDTPLNPDHWQHGLTLLWEWHTGIEAADGEPERGPVWLWAKRLRDGATREPEVLRVDGYANPVQVAAAMHELDLVGRPVKDRPGRWDGAAALDAACEAWGAEEASA